METNWSRVGSAQQYQGSLRNGTRVWDGDILICGAGHPAAACAAFQMRSNVAGRDSFCRSAAAAISCIVSLRVSRRGSAFFHGYASDCGSKDRKSTRLNSSHLVISYAVFCLKKKIITSYDNLIPHIYYTPDIETWVGYTRIQ